MRPGRNLPSIQMGFDGDIIKQASFNKYIPYKFRLLGIVIPYGGVYYPTMISDKETNSFRAGYRMLRVPLKFDEFGWDKSPTIVDQLIKIDATIRNENRPVGSTNVVKSVFNPTFRYILPCFHRGSDKPNSIKLLEVGKQIYDKIKSLQTQTDEDDPSKLAHGPIWVGDIVITKVDKDQKTGNEQFDILYEVRSGRDNKFSGKFSKDIYLEKNSEILDKLYNHSIDYGIFSKEEKKEIDDYNLDPIVAAYQPMDNIEMLRILAENPICLDAIDKRQVRIFSDVERYFKELNELGVKYLLASNLGNIKKIEHVPEVDDEDESDVNNVKDTELNPSMSIDNLLNNTSNEPKKEDKKEPDQLPDFLKGLK